MSSDDKKTLKMTEKTEEKKQKKGDKKSIGWFFGVIVLILISITFVLPVTLFAGKTGADIVFGKYDGKKIDLNDEYFRQQVNISAQNYQGDPNSLQGTYEIWNDAFLGTVLNRALNKMADDAGIVTTHDWLDRAVIKSGYYNGEDGTFSEEKYKNTEKLEKDAIREMIEKTVATQIVATDISSGKTSANELSFVKEVGAKGRAFEYVVFDALAYPNDLAAEFGKENASLFDSRVFSAVAVQSKEQADKIFADIESGATTLEDAAKTYSIDTFRNEGGKRPGMYRFGVEMELKNASDADIIFTAENGVLLDPIETSYGWLIARADEDTVTPDFADQKVLNGVKTYLNAKENEMVRTYLTEASETFLSRIENENFYDVAFDMGLEITDVPATTANPGNYLLFSAFQATDKKQYLAVAAQQDAEFAKNLYKASDDEVLSADVEGSKVIVKAGAYEENAAGQTWIDGVYSIAGQQTMLGDLQNAIFTSPLLQNDFASVFFEKMVGQN